MLESDVVLNFDLVARQLLRAIRGRRSQVAFARRLGYRGNPIADWEAGRRFPTVRRALRACSASGIDVRAAFARFHHEAPPDPSSVQSVAEWLERLRGKTSVAELATRSGCSRHQLGRWLSAQAEPRLPQLLRVLEAITGRISDLVAELVPIEQVPCLVAVQARRDAARTLAYEEPWTEAILRVLETRDYGALPVHRPGFVAQVLGIDEETEARCLAKLLASGLLREQDGRYRPVGSLTVDTRSVAALKAHWTRTALQRIPEPGADDLFTYNVLAASSSDLVRIAEVLRASYREIRAIVSATPADERVALLNLQLLHWPRRD